MQKKWLYRLILSYIPIFFAVVFCLMLVFFLTTSEMMKKQTLRGNLLFAGQVMQIVDSTLHNIDTLASKNLLLNDKVASYFKSPSGQAPYEYYEVTGAVRDFMTPLPMIDSVYLYRAADNKVLMHHFVSELPQFGDKEFIQSVMKDDRPYMWSGIRSLYLFAEENQPKSVVSLIKKVPYYSGEQGLIVINVRASSLAGLLWDMNPEGSPLLCMSDETGRSFAGFDRYCTGEQANGSLADTEDMKLNSPYTSWTLHVGLQSESLVSYISTFSYIWFVLGLAAVIAGIAAMTYISHRHYRPLEQILGRIHTFAEKKNSHVSRGKGEDEFAFIDSALESLIEQTNSFEQQQEEGIQYRRIHLYKEVMEGSRMLSREEWQREAAKVGMPGPVGSAVAAIVEIDLFPDFSRQYSQRDLALFKFTLRSAIQEIAEEEGENLWTEWTAPHRLGLLYRFGEAAGERHMLLKIKALSEKARAWVEQYLKFTVTIGIGGLVKDIADLALSFQQSAVAAERKVSLGPNRVTVYDPQLKLLSEGTDIDPLLQEMREAAQWFRLGNADWEMLLGHTFQTLAEGIYSRQDLTASIRTFKAQLKREQYELPQEQQEVWASVVLDRIHEIPDEFEWAEAARQALLPLLREADQPLQALRMQREQYTLAAQVCSYVSDHYTEPDLSLTHISEAYQVNIKTLSRIFKEEIGEKFVDYVARVRIEHAKRLLAETSESVQKISERTGYLSSISFIRVFKKLVGMTPGDFRKEQELRRL
ncbi:AraC family transcriptional regulator [Paenibacillus sp. FSL H8-0034]|uniref:AraC family transcriptional regulator n=1 Tax=Paenibacillus sp. FSL H8-0034 TaxID=2954671 RepID=UPI0030F6E786